MSRLIRESDIQDMLDDAQCISDGEYSYVCTEDIKLSKLPTVDAVPVVRCKECKKKFARDEDYKGNILRYICLHGAHEPNFFCADGERKEQDDATY